MSIYYIATKAFQKLAYSLRTDELFTEGGISGGFHYCGKEFHKTSILTRRKHVCSPCVKQIFFDYIQRPE